MKLRTSMTDGYELGRTDRDRYSGPLYHELGETNSTDLAAGLNPPERSHPSSCCGSVGRLYALHVGKQPRQADFLFERYTFDFVLTRNES